MENTLRSLIVLVMVISSLAVQAAPEPEDPKKQTPWHFYVDSREAFEMEKQEQGKVLFVDVRDPMKLWLPVLQTLST